MMLKFIVVSTPTQFGLGDGVTAAFQISSGGAAVFSPLISTLTQTDTHGNTTPITGYSMGGAGLINLGSPPAVGTTLAWTGKYSVSVPDSFQGVPSPLTKVVPMYLYQQYYDDEDLQGFINAQNAQSQGYLDWFNQTPLSVYTNPSINGPLLDWIGKGIYGIKRPVVSTGGTRSVTGYAALPYATSAYLAREKITTGSAFLVNDDLYKRTLTWHAYLGDGRNMSIDWIRRRVARFIFGANGADVPVDCLARVSIVRPPLTSSASYTTGPYATLAYATRKSSKVLASHALQIIVPNTAVSSAFLNLVQQGYLALPFQVNFTVSISQ